MKLFTKYNIPDNAGFVNVELAKDNTVWIDPMMMHMDKSEMGKRCCLIVQQYFSHLLKLAINNDYKMGYLYTKNFSEINETRLGYSRNKPNGLSGGEHLGNKIFDLIKDSNAIKTGMIGDIFDAEVMIEKLGVDKLSDFISNLILEELVLYTQEECMKYNIPLQDVLLKRKYWSYSNHKWVSNQILKLPFDFESNMAIIFIPKSFCENKSIYSYQKFYNKGMIPFLGKEAVSNRIRGLIRILKDKSIKPYYKMIKKQNPCNRDNVSKFISNHTDVYKEYKDKQLKYSNYQNYKN